jgi:protein TonB
MALRALVFSSDGSTTSTICHVLTDLGIEAEICSEMLVAVERITNQRYDTLLVDWDHHTEAVFLLKTQRELKLASHALTLALVQNDSDLPEALQAGANSVLRKPIDEKQAIDTLATAKQLMLARQSDQRELESRLAAAQAIPLHDEPEPRKAAPLLDLPEEEEKEDPSKKVGFLEQKAPRTALEAEESISESAPIIEPEPVPETKPLPSEAVRARALAILGYGDKTEAGKQEATEKATVAEAAPPASFDHAKVFSSLPENESSPEDEEPAARPRYGAYAAIAAVIIAGLLWAFAPGGSYLSIARRAVAFRRAAKAATQEPAQPATPAAPPTKAVSLTPMQPVEPDPAITSAQDEDASKIQVIENKPIPVAGAQQPPSNEPSPDPATDMPVATEEATSPTQQPTVAAPQPQLQPVASVENNATPGTTPPAPAVAPPAVNTPSVTASAAKPAPTPLAPAPIPGEGRTGVIIPDSLRGSPQAAPATAYEPFTIPEETSRGLIVKKIDPEYPLQAIPQRLEGTVVLQAWVAPDGTVRDVKLVRGYFVLGKAAFDAVRQWRFKPYSQNGKAIDFQTYVTVNFKLPS